MLKRIWGLILTLLALLFLIAYSIPAFDPNISNSTRNILEIIQWVSWSAFALDLIYNLVISPNKKNFLIRHPLDILSVILPFLRPLRLLRVISFGSLVFQKIALGKQLAITVKLIVISSFLAYISAIQITLSERDIEGSNIKNFGDGLWWSITTITTVGYGDRFPVTTEGRILAVALMLVGISLLGTITANIAAWFVRMSDQKI